MEIFVRRRTTERSEQTRDVQRCTSTCCICILSIVISVRCMVVEMHLRIRKYKGDVLLRTHPREREREMYYAVKRYLVVRRWELRPINLTLP